MDESGEAELPGSSDPTHGSWPAHRGELRAMRTALRSWLAPLRLDGSTEDDLILAMNEAASNAVEHAYPPALNDNGSKNGSKNGPENRVHIMLQHTQSGTVCIEITDHGTWREPGPERNGRGLGIPLMHRLIASVLIQKDGHGTRVLLHHPIAGSATDDRSTT
jgi:serine/threonine-protein kinase RsbW